MTAAAILMVIWTGHSIPPAVMPAIQACEAARDAIRANDESRDVDVWCVPDSSELVS
jgi:hypothetical protein